MKYLTAKETAAKWGLTPRRVQDLCKQGLVAGATRHGREWLIPVLAPKPADGRKASVEEKEQNYGNYLSFITNYTEPGSADKVLKSLADNEVAKDMFLMQLALYRGDIQKSVSIAKKYMVPDASAAQRGLVGKTLALNAICLGDTDLWAKTEIWMKEAKFKNENQRHVMEFWIAANASAIYDSSLCPEWFRRGDFSHLPFEHYPIARFYYVKYLYIRARNEAEEKGDRQLAMDFIGWLPYLIEPLISQTEAEGIVLTEIYLRFMCASAYHIASKDDLARQHIVAALNKALPDRLYLPIAEYYRRIGHLMEDVLEQVDFRALAEVKKLSKQTNEGWTHLHNTLLNRSIYAHLSHREQQIARLAAYGYSNKEISDRMNITVNAVKQILKSAMDKTGADSRGQLYKYV